MLRHSHLAPPAVVVRRALLVVAAALPIVLAAVFLTGTPGAVWTVLGLVAGFVSRVVPHGYWIVLALVATLRPVVQESGRKAVQRVTGTLLGVLIPIPLIYFLRRQPWRLSPRRASWPLFRT